MEKITKTIDLPTLVSYLQVVSLWILILSMPFRMGKFPLWAMISAGVLFFAEYVVNKRWRAWQWDRNMWLYVAMMAFYLLAPIWQIWSDGFNQRFGFVLGERLPLMLCGIIGILGFGDKVKTRHMGYAFLAACVLTSVYIISESGGFAFFSHSHKEQSELFMETRIRLVSSHMMYNIFLNISLIFAFYILDQKGIRLYERPTVIASCLWIFYILTITEGRIGLFTVLLLFAAYLIVYTYKRGIKWFVAAVICYIGICAGVLSQHERFTTNHVSHDPRMYIWQAGVEVAKTKPIVGHGVCEAKELMIEECMKDGSYLHEFYTERIPDSNWHRIQPHNAFIEAWCEFGILGVLILAFIFVYPLTMRPKHNYLYIYAVVGCFLIQSLTDSFFSPMLYCLTIILFTSQNEILRGNETEKPDVV